MHTKEQTRMTITAKGRRGQGLVEFALVLPLLMLLILAVVEFGWIVFNYTQLNNGMREGLRYGSVPGYSNPQQFYQCDAIRNRIISLANLSGIQAANITILYDDGRPITGLGTTIGTCPAGGSYTANGSYVPPTGDTRVRTTTPLLPGDRIVIRLNISVRFLTPVLTTMFPTGVQMNMESARTIFPDGLGL